MPRSTAPIGVLGATGVTGRLVAAALAESGVTVRLGGRRREAAERVAARLPGGPHEVRVADVGDDRALDAFLDGLASAVTCAGPFARLGAPVAEAALRTGTPLLDVTGEQTWVRACAERFGGRAARRGVPIVPAVGVDGGLADCAVSVAARDLRPPLTVDVAYQVFSMRTSRASRLSALGIAGDRCQRWVDGGPREAVPGGALRLLDLGPPWGVAWGTWIPGVETLLIPRHLPCERLDTWVEVPRWVGAALQRAAPWAQRVLTGPGGDAVRRLAARSAREPGGARRGTTFRLVADVRGARGGRRRVSLSGRDVYALTGHIAAAGALAAAELGRGGVLTTAQLADPEAFLAAVPGLAVERRDG